MDTEEVARKLEDFQDYLSISNIFTDIIRWLGWAFIRGLAWLVDSLENMTDSILLLKGFYNTPEIVMFVDSIRPFLYVLLAFSILYAGYLLIFNKKFNREGMIINIFVASVVITLLASGMDKAGQFTDAAIDAVKVDSLYQNDEGSLSNSIIQRNITDLSEFDKNNWASIDLDIPNSTPPSKVININVREKYSKDTESVSTEGKEISQYLLSFNNIGEYRAEKLDQSGLEWNNEYYFRYSVDWFTILATLGIIGFTLFSISLKLARLFFELTFNYILAMIIAPIDVHDGQKTKMIIQSILNTFMVIIMIFLSMKVYMIGTAYLEDTLPTFTYVIALIAFSIAVIDGPNMVERLFGIDAGLKSGWGTLAGAYAGAKVASGLAKGTTNGAKGLAGMMGAGKGKGKENHNAANSYTGKEKSNNLNNDDSEGQPGVVAGNSLEDEMKADQKKKEQYRNQVPSPNEKNNNGQIKGVGSPTPTGNDSGSSDEGSSISAAIPNDEVASTIEGKQSISSVDQHGNLQSTPSNVNRNVSRLSNPNTETAPRPSSTSSVSPSTTVQSPDSTITVNSPNIIQSPSNSDDKGSSSTNANLTQHVQESVGESESSATQSTINHSRQMEETIQGTVQRRVENKKSETPKLPKTYSTQTISSQERISRIKNASKRK